MPSLEVRLHIEALFYAKRRQPITNAGWVTMVRGRYPDASAGYILRQISALKAAARRYAIDDLVDDTAAALARTRARLDMDQRARVAVPRGDLETLLYVAGLVRRVRAVTALTDEAR